MLAASLTLARQLWSMTSAAASMGPRTARAQLIWSSKRLWLRAVAPLRTTTMWRARRGDARSSTPRVQAFGRLDIVVNNAGNRRNGPLLEITPEDFEAVLAVHLKGALYVSQPAFEVMKDQGYGRLLFTGSSAGMFGNAGQATYAAAKAGVFGLSQAVAIEGEPYGVTANVLLPMASTQRALAGMTEQAFDALQVDRDRQTLDADQVSSLVAYLVSEECKLTHQVFASAAGRCYSAFVATTAGWRHTGPGIATADAVAANVDMILDRTGYHVPDSLRADISDSMQPPTPAERIDPRNVVGAYFAAVLNKDAEAMRGLFTQSAQFDVPWHNTVWQ